MNRKYKIFKVKQRKTMFLNYFIATFSNTVFDKTIFSQKLKSKKNQKSIQNSKIFKIINSKIQNSKNFEIGRSLQLTTPLHSIPGIGFDTRSAIEL